MNTSRRELRTVPEKLAFIQLDHDDGGRVLNVSELGLCFETFASIRQNGPIHFWFSLDLSDRIEAVGELAWTNATRKIGGLRFIDLSPHARGQIRGWIRQNSKHNEFTAETFGSEVAAVPTLSDGTQLVPLERYLSATRRQLIRGIVLGILASLAIVALFIRYSSMRKHVDASQLVSAHTAPASSDPQGEVKVLPSEASHDAFASTPGKIKHSVPTGYAADNPPRLGPVKHRQQSLDPSAGNVSMSSAMQLKSPETRSARKTLASPQQLWSAVQGGDAQAAVTLADLYLRGDRVPANCDQARVLLLVASEKGNAQAIKELRELDKTGCPAPAQ